MIVVSLIGMSGEAPEIQLAGVPSIPSSRAEWLAETLAERNGSDLVFVISGEFTVKEAAEWLTSGNPLVTHPKLVKIYDCRELWS